MGTKIPYAMELQIVRKRLQSTLQETIDEFGISRGGVRRVMVRNQDLVDEIKAELRASAKREILDDLTE